MDQPSLFHQFRREQPSQSCEELVLLAQEDGGGYLVDGRNQEEEREQGLRKAAQDTTAPDDEDKIRSGTARATSSKATAEGRGTPLRCREGRRWRSQVPEGADGTGWGVGYDARRQVGR